LVEKSFGAWEWGWEENFMWLLFRLFKNVGICKLEVIFSLRLLILQLSAIVTLSYLPGAILYNGKLLYARQCRVTD